MVYGFMSQMKTRSGCQAACSLHLVPQSQTVQAEPAGILGFVELPCSRRGYRSPGGLHRRRV